MEKYQKTALIVLLLNSLVLLSACTKDESRPAPPLKENVKGVKIEDKETQDGNWFIKDPVKDSFEGVGSEKAQVDFALKNQNEIIVAVIDNGVDVNHEDLKNKIWTNPGETGLDSAGNNKSNNGIDDDQNGYVDDVHGWNFLGGADGKNVEDEALEVTRESLRYDEKIAKGETLTEAEQKYFDHVNEDYNQQLKDAQETMGMLLKYQPIATAAMALLKDKIQLVDYSVESLNAIVSSDPEVIKAKTDLLDISNIFKTVARFFRIYDATKTEIEFNLNKKFNPRAIVGDDPNDFTQSAYGNNDMKGADGSHGTHVAGLIAAEAGNGVGIDGVAVNVKIMVLRAVPNGDERDKDVVMAVRYAVRNGAKVINMSFGKNYSPSKSKVDEAFLLAAKNDVLIFHASGNDGKDNDLKPSFPNRNVLESAVLNGPAQITTWLEVGASAQKRGLNLVAPFSNYGKKDVDLFSPGYQVKSSTPDNTYAVYSGTSMASPVAAGVGALLLSNFDGMTALQAKAIILHETRTYDALEVHLPGSAPLDLPVPFAGLSAKSGVIDAYNSIRFARELTN